MAIKISEALANGILAGGSIKDLMDGGFLYIFNGAVPADADAALDMVSTHTELAKLSEDGLGSAGMDWDSAAVGGVLPKDPGQTVEGLIAFDGATSGPGTLDAHFFRLCGDPADDGRGAGGAGDYRIQGTVGGPGSGADYILAAASLTDNGSNTVGCEIASITMPQA